MSDAFASLGRDYRRYVRSRQGTAANEALPMAAAARDGLLPDGLCGCSCTCPCLSCTCPCITCGAGTIDDHADA